MNNSESVYMEIFEKIDQRQKEDRKESIVDSPAELDSPPLILLLLLMIERNVEDDNMRNQHVKLGLREKLVMFENEIQRKRKYDTMKNVLKRIWEDGSMVQRKQRGNHHESPAELD